MKSIMSLGAACMILLALGGCKKTADQAQAPKCNDFNNRQTVNANYSDSIVSDMANYFEGDPCAFRWKLSAVDCCENAPLEMHDKITILAADTTATVKIGYEFEHTGTPHYIEMKRSDPYISTINGVKATVVDITNPTAIYNRCTSCLGTDPTPVNTFIEIDLPTTGNSETDRQKMKALVKAVDLQMTYIYNLD